MESAQPLTQAGHGRLVSYSRKVFIPLTQLCRDVCHYCTFAKAPRMLEAPYLSMDQVLAIARAGAAAGCKEALFTLGDQAGTALCRRAACASEVGIRHHARLSRFGGAHGVQRDRAPAALESRCDDGCRLRPLAAGQCLHGPHVGDGRRTAVAARRPALRIPGQEAGRALGGFGRRRRTRSPDDDGVIDRHRRDARGALVRAARHSRAARSATGIFRKSSSRTFAPNPAPKWPMRPSPCSRSSSGPSQQLGCCSARR